MCLLLCETFGSQHAVAVWGLSATTRRRNRGLFLWNLSQRENQRVVSGGGVREEVCTLYRWGRGYAACSRKDSCWLTWGLCSQTVVWEEGTIKPPYVCITCKFELNKSLSIHRALYRSAVWQTIELSCPCLHIPEIGTTCEHQGVQSACDTGRVDCAAPLHTTTARRKV
jgi:hypothetical protein